MKRLEGAFAIVILFAGHRGFLICARRGSPLAIGYGEREMFIGSDAIALAPLTRKICYLDEGDWALVSAGSATLFDARNRQTWRPVREMAISDRAIGKGAIAISCTKRYSASTQPVAERIELPWSDPFSAPVLYAIPVQLLAYHLAVFKGADVDQPRNLAKSVTVE